MNRREALKATLGIAALIPTVTYFNSKAEAEAEAELSDNETPYGMMVLQKNADPKIFDKNGKEVTHHIYKVEILPGRIVKAYPYAADKDGKHYCDENIKGVALAPEFFITKIVGEFSREVCWNRKG